MKIYQKRVNLIKYCWAFAYTFESLAHSSKELQLILHIYNLQKCLKFAKIFLKCRKTITDYYFGPCTVCESLDIVELRTGK